MHLFSSVPEMRAVAEKEGLKEGEAHLVDLVDFLVRAIGMPRSLASVGGGRDKFEETAESSLHDVWSATNSVPLKTKEQIQVLDILDQFEVDWNAM